MKNRFLADVEQLRPAGDALLVDKLTGQLRPSPRLAWLRDDLGQITLSACAFRSC